MSLSYYELVTRAQIIASRYKLTELSPFLNGVVPYTRQNKQSEREYNNIHKNNLMHIDLFSSKF